MNAKLCEVNEDPELYYLFHLECSDIIQAFWVQQELMEILPGIRCCFLDERCRHLCVYVQHSTSLQEIKMTLSNVGCVFSLAETAGYHITEQEIIRALHYIV